MRSGILICKLKFASVSGRGHIYKQMKEYVTNCMQHQFTFSQAINMPQNSDIKVNQRSAAFSEPICILVGEGCGLS